MEGFRQQSWLQALRIDEDSCSPASGGLCSLTSKGELEMAPRLRASCMLSRPPSLARAPEKSVLPRIEMASEFGAFSACIF